MILKGAVSNPLYTNIAELLYNTVFLPLISSEVFWVPLSILVIRHKAGSLKGICVWTAEKLVFQARKSLEN